MSDKTRRASFPRQVPRPLKRESGRTSTLRTPVNVRTDGVRLSPRTAAHVTERLGRELGKFALHIERVSVRFLDVNGPRGGADRVCRIKVVLNRMPTVFVEENGITLTEAFDKAAPSTERAVRRSIERSGLRTPKRGQGRSLENLLQVAGRPEKRHRNVPVDTSKPGVSASVRKVGAGSTARRNAKLNTAGMTSMLEDSATGSPSRKSTRKSENRSKRDSNLRRREMREVRSPKAQATRARARTRNRP